MLDLEPIISVKNVSKTFKINKRANGLPGHIANLFIPKYQEKKAVDDISFEIGEGEMVGFIGSNGAGKSTTIKMLSGILYPDQGEIEVTGYIPYKQRKEYVSKIGVVFGQKSQLAWDLPVIDSFELLKHIYKIPQDEYKKNKDLFIDLLEMKDFVNQPVRQLSLGQRMRCDIAAALLHSPKLVFFDEPTIGLDVLAKERIREFIRNINKEKGITMLFTTHDMQDIEQTCKRLIIIDKGKKIYNGSVEDIKKQFGVERKLIVEFEKDYDITNIKDVHIESKDVRTKIFSFRNENISIKNLIQQIMINYDIKDMTICETDIETIVRQIYEGGISIQ